jgi:hypothetical protein
MSVSYSQHVAAPTTHAQELVLEQVGMLLRLKAGDFTAMKASYTIIQDEEYTLAVDAALRYISGYLVWDTVAEDAGFLVDEIYDGESGFDFEGSIYNALQPLFSFVVPADATTLDAIDISVYHMVAPTPEVEGP